MGYNFLLVYAKSSNAILALRLRRELNSCPAYAVEKVTELGISLYRSMSAHPWRRASLVRNLAQCDP